MKKLLWLVLLPLALAGCGEHRSTGPFQITLAIYQPLCIDVRGASTNNGDQVQAYACGAGKRSQEWLMKPVNADGGVLFQNVNSSFCMAVSNTPDTAPGQFVIQETCVADGSNPDQVWNLEKGSGAPDQPGFRLVSAASKQCLDLPFGATAAESLMQQYTCTPNDPAQGWLLNAVDEGKAP